MNRMDQYLRNALDVSYFETLLLGEAWRSMDLVVVHMGPKVLQGYTAYKNYYENLEKAYLRKLGKSDRA
ncbi:MAG TPA: hypothetical protein VK664_14705 [Flavitalea sp.]|nr:hypothetical protein [Flavitalea sp.]